MSIAMAPVRQAASPTQQGEAASRDGNPVSTFVSAAGDLVAKPGWDSDSWFVTSHLQTSRGPVDLLVHLMHLVPPGGGPGILQAMASLLDTTTGRYVSQEVDFPDGEGSLSTQECDVVTPIASISGDPQALSVKGTWAKAGVSCDITLSQAGPLLANAGAGVWPMLGGLTYHYALPTLTTTGTITLDGEVLTVSGNSWLDRQWATTTVDFARTPARWVWFGVVLDDGDRISCWDLIEADRRHRFATIVHPDGGHEVVGVEPTVENASKPWTSPATGRTYPTRWDVQMPQIDGRLVIEPDVLAQEFVSPTEGYHKYEASAPVTGTLRGRPITGHATIELVGDWA